MSVGSFFKGIARRIVYGPGSAAKAPGYIDAASAEARAGRQASPNTPLDTLNTHQSIPPQDHAVVQSRAVETPIEAQFSSTSIEETVGTPSVASPAENLPHISETSLGIETEATASVPSGLVEPAQSMASGEKIAEIAPIAFAEEPVATPHETLTSSESQFGAAHGEPSHLEAAQSATPESQTPDFLTSSSTAQHNPAEPAVSIEETASPQLQAETQMAPEMATTETAPSAPEVTTSLFSTPVTEQPVESSAPAMVATAIAGAATATAAASLSPFFEESKSELVESKSESESESESVKSGLGQGLGLGSSNVTSNLEANKDTSPLGHFANIVHSSKVGVVSHKKACCPSTTLSNIVSTSYGKLTKKISPVFSSAISTNEVRLLTEARDTALKSVKVF